MPLPLAVPPSPLVGLAAGAGGAEALRWKPRCGPPLELLLPPLAAAKAKAAAPKAMIALLVRLAGSLPPLHTEPRSSSTSLPGSR